MLTPTPAPWFWEYHPDVKKPIALVANQRDVILATGDDGRSWIDVSDGDANLIKAAPDLLEACRAALANLDYLQSLWSKEAITDRVADGLRGAVLKALGEDA